MRSLFILLFVTVLSGAVFFGGQPVRAQVKISQQSTNQEQTPPTAEQWLTQCTVVEQNIRQKLELFTKRRSVHLEKYSVVSTTFDEIAATFSSSGFDSEPLTILIPELDNRIQIFTTTVDEFIQQLELTAEQACAEYDTFTDNLGFTRNSLQGTRLAASDIKQFATNMLMPAARDILEEMR